MPHRVSLALQGGGAHGAFTWGVLDRLLDEVRAGRLEFAALSGTSAGAINAALCAAGLGDDAQQAGNAERAQQLLTGFWNALAEQAFYSGNPLLGGTVQNYFPNFVPTWNIDWSPAAIAYEMVSLVLSPYDAPFYSNPLVPLLRQFLPPPTLAALNRAGAPPLFVCATNVNTNKRRVFSRPDISLDSLLASAALPTNFQAIEVDGAVYWDGVFMGNPALAPLVKAAQDMIVVSINPRRINTAPRTAREILDRLNDIGGNAPLILEMNAIHAVNKLLSRLRPEQAAASGFQTVHMHLLRDDELLAPLGVVGKGNASAAFLAWLHDAGHATAERWLAAHIDDLGLTSTASWKEGFDPEFDLIDPVLKGG